MKRKGYGLGKGMGYKNLMPMDSHIHSLSAKGVKQKPYFIKEPYGLPFGLTEKDKFRKLKAMGTMKSFVIDSEYSVVVWYEDTRSGFRHMAKLMQNGREVETSKAVYYNRTWERYKFQTVINSVIRKHFDEKKAEEKIKLLEKKAGLYRTDAKGKVPKIKDKMTLDEVEERFRYELNEGMINTGDTPHYDGVTQFGNMLRDMGIKVLDAKGKSRIGVREGDFGKDDWQVTIDDVGVDFFTSKKDAEAEAKRLRKNPPKGYGLNAKSKHYSKVNKSNLVDAIMDYESGDADIPTTISLFSYLIKTKKAWSLQGHYGRTAQSLIKAGILDDKGNVNEKRLFEIMKDAGKEMAQLNAMYSLETTYDSRASFYGKARVDVDDTNPNIKTLYSYDTKVAEVRFGKPKVFGLYSQTTTRHIKEFLKQEGFKVESSDQIIEDYGA